MRSIFLLGKDTADEWRLLDVLGGSPNKFFRATQRIAFGVTQPELLHVNVVATARELVKSHGAAFPAHLYAAWVWRARDPEFAERHLETARALATPDHPLVDLMPTVAEWTLEPVRQQLIEIHPGRMWRVVYQFPLVGAPLHSSSVATVIKLGSGDVAIINPIEFDDATARAITELGPVRWVITQGKGHSLFVESTRRRFRGSLAIATEGHLRHPPANHLAVDGLLGHSRLPDELELIPIEGHLFEEVMLLDRPSRTLIAQDVIAMTGGDRSLVTRLYNFGFGLIDPIGFLSYSPILWQNMPALHRSLGKLRDHDFSHVLAAHGPIAPRTGDVEKLRAAIAHTRAISSLGHKAMLARFFTAQPMFLRDLLRYLQATKGKSGARMRETAKGA